MSTLENCDIPALTVAGGCLTCSKEYARDTASGNKCVKVDDSILTDVKFSECANFTKTGCEYCNSGFYLSSAECKDVPTDKEVSNCSRYVASTSTTIVVTCSTCDSGYFLSDSKCVRFPEVSNCMGFSLYLCNTCASTAVKDMNTYLVGITARAKSDNFYLGNSGTT